MTHKKKECEAVRGTRVLGSCVLQSDVSHVHGQLKIKVQTQLCATEFEVFL